VLSGVAVSETRVHELLDVPELDYWPVHEEIWDWRLGRRIVVVRPQLSLGWGCSLALLMPPLAVLAIGAVIGWGTGQENALLCAAAIAAPMFAAIVGLFLVPFLKGSGRRETVIDWEAGTFAHSYRGKVRVHPLSSVQALHVMGSEESGQRVKATATLEAQVDGQSYPIFETRSAEEPVQTSCTKLAMAAHRLAESLSVPWQITISGNAVDREEILRSGRSIGEVAQKYLELARHVRGSMMLAEYKGKAEDAERHRAVAVLHYMQAHILDPSLPEPLLELGRLTGDTAMRLQAVDAVTQLDPSNAAALLERAHLLLLDDKPDEAISVYTQIIEREPSGAAYQGRSDVYQELNQFDQAVSDLTAAIELQSNNAALYSERADCLMTWHDESGQPKLIEEALADYDAAIRLAPDDDTLKTNRCRVLKAAGKTDQAIAELSRVIAAHPKSAYAIRTRGRLYLESARSPQAALDDFSQALKVLQADLKPARPAMRKLIETGIGTTLRDRAEALRHLGRLVEADQDEQGARELLRDEG